MIWDNLTGIAVRGVSALMFGDRCVAEGVKKMSDLVVNQVDMGDLAQVQKEVERLRAVLQTNRLMDGLRTLQVEVLPQGNTCVINVTDPTGDEPALVKAIAAEVFKFWRESEGA